MNHRTVTRRSECLFINFIQHSAAFTGGYYFQEKFTGRPRQSLSCPPEIYLKFIPSGGLKTFGNVVAAMSVSLGLAWGNIRQSRPFASVTVAPTDGLPVNQATARQLSSEQCQFVNSYRYGLRERYGDVFHPRHLSTIRAGLKTLSTSNSIKS